jgi:type IX secretion system PorP/SprF family membrane protein
MYTKSKIFTLILMSAFVQILSAQDVHFSQYLNSPMNLGPGMAGVFGGDLRLTANYRNQWRVAVPYNTFSGVVENKFYTKKGRYDQFFTGGLMLNYDQQGDLKLTSTQIGIPLSYTVPLVRKNMLTHNFLTIGLQPSFGQRAFGTTKWTFDQQYVDCFFDPGAAITESNLINSNSLTYFDLAGGINYRWQAKAYRSKVDLGVGLHHINRPNHDFWEGNNTVRLQRRAAFYTSMLFQVRPKLDLVGQGMYQRQGAYRQLAVGIGARLHMNQKPYKEFAIQAGVNYRATYNDALILHLEGHWRTWTLGFSYDWNLSDATLATQGIGGPEVALIYRLYRVKPLSKFKSCPII